MMNPVEIDDVKLEEIDLSNRFEDTTKVFISSEKNFSNFQILFSRKAQNLKFKHKVNFQCVFR